MADTAHDTDLQEFRAEARVWIGENFPKSLGPSPYAAPAGADLERWRQAMAGRGWGAPTWPVAYGGAGLSHRHARIVAEELVRAGAFNPAQLGLGLAMVGPAILEYGDEDQKARHLPAIARGELSWCLGYSEPNAGSDLASLATRCEHRGDHWVVNGQKVWTSMADRADWCGALVRTNPKAPKHDGISFVLLSMHQPGVEARPIRLIDGSAVFCETFFTDARVEAGDMLGPQDGGWAVGKRLLQYERASQTGETPVSAAAPVRLEQAAREYVGVDGQGRLADPDLRQRMTRQLMHARAHDLTLSRLAAEARGGAPVSNAASVLKNSATTASQSYDELLVEIMGSRGLGREGDGFSPEQTEAVRHWLSGKAASIYGGSVEVQNNIIAKRILGLPDAPRGA